MKRQATRIMYVEIKSDRGDRGRASIRRVRFSKSGRTIFIGGMGLQSCKGAGISANYYYPETGIEYWISGPKKNGEDRHWTLGRRRPGLCGSRCSGRVLEGHSGRGRTTARSVLDLNFGFKLTTTRLRAAFFLRGYLTMMHDLEGVIPASIRFTEGEASDAYQIHVANAGDTVVLNMATTARGRDRSLALFLSERSALRLIESLSHALLQKNQNSN
jgi:hypothetical protein